MQLPEDVKKQVENLESTLLFWNHKRDTDTPLLKIAIQKASQKKTIEIKYQSKREITFRTIIPIGIYANHGKWYMSACDCQIGEMRIFRVDRVLEINDSEKEFPPPDTTLYDILHSYVIKEPIHIYVKLSDIGMLACKDNPYFETSICSNSDGVGGFIDQTIDRSDFDYVSHFFMGLGTEAEVITPLEMREKIRKTAQEIQEQYK